MDYQFFKQWENRRKRSRQKKLLRAVALGLACAVGAGTVYSMILPAITMTPEPICGKEEHTHTEECYGEKISRELVCDTPVHHHTDACYDGNLICGKADYVIHSHNEFCYDADGSLICPLPEIEEHRHTAACYETRRELICGLEETPAHTHGPECYTRVRDELICPLEETPGHVHTEECYTVEKKLVCTEEHEHTDACYVEEKVLTCTLPESEGHTHTDECYAWHDELTCTLPEGEGHTHTEACYAESTELICGKPEVIAHTHTASCYDQDGNLICGLPEVLIHNHTEDCVKDTVEQVLICGKEEHTHTDACYPVPETAETTVPDETTEGTVPGETTEGTVPGETTEDTVPGETAEGTVPGETTEGTVPGETTEDTVPGETTEGTVPGETTEDTVPGETTEGTVPGETTEGTVPPVTDPATGLVLTEQKLTVQLEQATVYVSGLLPEGAELKVVPVQAEIPGSEVLFAVDITIVLPDGSTYEPPEGTLTVEIRSPEIEGQGLDVYYVPEAGEPEAMPSQSETGSVSFEAPHFSTYAVVKNLPPEHEHIGGGDIIDPATGLSSGLTWEITKDRRREYTLHFRSSDGQPHPMPDFERDKSPWYAKIHQLGCGVHMDLEDNVTRVGKWCMADLTIHSMHLGKDCSELAPYSFAYSTRPRKLVIPGTVKHIGSTAFGYGAHVEELIIEEGVEQLDAWSVSCYHGVLKIPASVKSLSGGFSSSASYYDVDPSNLWYTSVDGVVYSKDMTTLIDHPKNKAVTEYVVPRTVTSIVTGALKDINGIRRLVVSNSVEHIGGEFLRFSPGIEEVIFEDGMKDSVFAGGTTGWFYGTDSLRVLKLPENTKVIFNGYGYNATTFTMSEFTFPSGVCKTGHLGVGSAPMLQTVNYNARNANILNKSPIFGTSSYDLNIGVTVDVLPENFAQYSCNARSIHFQGPNQLTIAPGAMANAPKPYVGLSGKILIDENGLVFLCDEAGAHLLDIPNGLKTASVPASVTLEDSSSLPVVSVRKDAIRYNYTLTALEFAPEVLQTIQIDTYGLANCPTLESVNGRQGLKEVEALFTRPVGRNAFYNTSLTGSSSPGTFEQDMDGKKSLTIDEADSSQFLITLASKGKTAQWQSSSDDPECGGYRLLTGDTVTITAAADNTNGQTDKKYRIYLQTTSDLCSLSLTPGTDYTFDGQPARCEATEDPQVIYLEMQPRIGSTMSTQITAVYPSPNTPGGGLRVWGVVVDSNAPAGQILPSSHGTIDASWRTQRDPFMLEKTSIRQECLDLEGQWDEEHNVTIVRPNSNFHWKLKLTRKEAEASSYGKDYISGVELADEMDLPAGMEWDPRIIEAVQKGDLRLVMGKELKLGNDTVLTLSLPNSNRWLITLQGLHLHWDETRNVMQLCWNWNSTNSASEIDSMDLTLSLSPIAFRIDPNVFNDQTDNTITNHLTAKIHYTHSADEELTSQASKTVRNANGRVEISKSAIGGKYMGDDVPYTIKIYNEGGLPWLGNPDQDYSLRDDMFYGHKAGLIYIKPENMQTMFDNAESMGMKLRIKIDQAALRPWVSVTDVTGSTAYRNSANTAPAVPNTHTVWISRNDQGKFIAEVDVDVYEADNVPQLLQDIGYAVTCGDRYSCEWIWPHETKPVVIPGGAEMVFTVPATVKDSIMLLNRDEPGEHPSASVEVYNYASFYSIDNKDHYTTVDSASCGRHALRDAHLYKSVSRDGVTLGSALGASDQDVLDYSLYYDHVGTGSQRDLPMVDELTGTQYLLVRAADNTQLADKGLDVFTDKDVQYYKLGPGEYHGLKAGHERRTNCDLIADTVTVVRDEATGNLHTTIKWYFSRLPAETYRMEVCYKSLVDFSMLTTYEWSIGNKVWMNDQPEHRLYAGLWGGGTLIHFDKDIVQHKGDTPGADVVEESKYSQISSGDSVTYRLTLHNTGNAPYTISGKNLADCLPSTGNVFQWTRDNVTGVHLEFSDPGIQAVNMDQWYLGDTYGSMVGDMQQYILWPDDAYITFPAQGKAYIYVTLRYPSNISGGEALWDQYTAAINGRHILNTLYVYRYPASVSHDLRQVGRVCLQKGVLFMGGRFYAPGNSFELTSGSRNFYNNTDSWTRLVGYYVSIYNSGPNRLYLDTIYDSLPKGFTHNRLFRMGTTDPSAVTFITTIGGNKDNIWQGQKLVDLPSDTVYRSAEIHAYEDPGGLRFDIGAGTGPYSVHWDKDLEKYYLESKEAIVFGYTCNIGLTGQTEDTATNLIGMPYTDVTDTGVTLSDVRAQAIWPDVTQHPYTDLNDGVCSIQDGSSLQGRPGFPGTASGKWLVSQVNLTRGEIIPGVDKKTVSYQAPDSDVQLPYTSSVAPEDTVNWEVQLKNNGSQSIFKYTFWDQLPKPYEFRGPIRLEVWDSEDRLMKGFDLFSIEDVKDDTVLLKYSSASPKALTIGDENSFYEDKGDFKVSFLRAENGDLVMKLYVYTNLMSIPEAGGHVDVTLSGVNDSKVISNAVFTNKAYLQPMTQAFTDHRSGTAITGEDGNKKAVMNSAPFTVAFGYSTSSEKQVTEIGTEGNTALSTDPAHRSITLQSRNSPFTYTLRVKNDIDELPITKLVIIDNLPDVGDTFPFDKTAPRRSAFRVNLADNPNFKVTATNPDGEVTNLNYTLQYSVDTDFGGPQSPDWKGEDAGTTAAWTETPAGARAFRVIIRDHIPSKSVVEVSFNAIAAENAEPGAVAWNNFGYHYALENVPGELEAMPLEVGVQVPSIPVLRKELVDISGQPVEADRDLAFTFRISDQTGAKTTEVTVKVAKGQTFGETLLDLDNWTWEENVDYLITESGLDRNWEFLRWSGGTATEDGMIFRYDPTSSLTLRCTNRQLNWQMELLKEDSKDHSLLPGAVFALYTADKTEAMTQEAYDALAMTQKPPRAETINGTDWYLMYLDTTDEQGRILWEDLSQDQYRLVEWKAPDGYYPAEDQLIVRGDQASVSIRVPNQKGFVLPKTGGAGTCGFRALGLMTAAGALFILKKRKKEGGQAD